MKIQVKQKGAAAIEFAIIFPIFFLIFYAVVTYGLIFAAQQTITLAASEGARAAVRYQKGGRDVDRLELHKKAACDMANESLQWLRKIAGQTSDLVKGDCIKGIVEVTSTSTACSGLSGVSCMQVVVKYDYKKAPFIPRLLGPLMSLPTPNILQGQAVAQISLID